MLKAILFDLGDTLFDTKPSRLWTVFKAGGLLGYEYLQSLGVKLPSFGKYYAAHRQAVQFEFIKSRLNGGEVSCGHLLRKLCADFNIMLNEDQLLELAWHWYSPNLKHNKVDPYVRPILSEIRDMGIALAIVSNTFVPGSVLDRHLEMEGLLEFFPCRVYSSELGYRKPNSKIFLHTLDLMKVGAKEAVFVGDNIHNDIRGAQRVGMLAILRDPKSQTRTHWKAEHLIRNLKELKQILPILNATLCNNAAAAQTA
jgi:HAD superfamily hydrolase (TIGR01549 family)